MLVSWSYQRSQPLLVAMDEVDMLDCRCTREVVDGPESERLILGQPAGRKG